MQESAEREKAERLRREQADDGGYFVPDTDKPDDPFGSDAPGDDPFGVGPPDPDPFGLR